MRFTAFGQRARVEATKIELQGPLVERLLAATIRNGDAPVADLPETLFELLVPLELKAAASQGRDLQLVLDEGSAAYPWELLVDRGSARDEPVGVGAGLLRQLREENAKVVAHPEENRILVVGDPRSALPKLRGAREEAIHVASLFAKRDWKVYEQIRHEEDPPGISASTVMTDLLTRDPRIVHLAGHGVYDPLCRMRTGMVLGDGEHDDDPLLLLTPAEVAQMRLQPELVFINCCHLGRIESTDDVPPLHQLAANLAAQFIRSGVKAVVAAGWPVDDAAAKTFCNEFYGVMLNGGNFGAAVRRARQQTFRAHRGTNTWGAYQCYGDPGFKLLMDLGVRSRVFGRHYSASWFVDASELVIELDNLVSRAKVAKGSERKQLAARCEELRVLAESEGWSRAAGVLIGSARVHGELGDYSRAIELTEEAGRLSKGGVALADLEQLANYRVRLGKENESLSTVRKGIDELKHLIRRRGKTAERLSLVAGSHKRLAQLHSELGSPKSEVRASLREMTAHYVLAADLGEPDWYYPATNALLGIVLLGGPWSKPPRKGTIAAADFASVPPTPGNDKTWADRGAFQERLDRVDAIRRRQDIREFWDAVALSDLEVVRELAKGTLAESTESIVRKYNQAMTLYGSHREVGSVINQWEFAEQMARKLGRRKDSKALSDLSAMLD